MAGQPDSVLACPLECQPALVGTSSEKGCCTPLCLTTWQSRKFRPILRMIALVVIQAFLALDLAWASGPGSLSALRVKAAEESEVATGLEEQIKEASPPDPASTLTVVSVSGPSPSPEIPDRPTIWSQRYTSLSQSATVENIPSVSQPLMNRANLETPPVVAQPSIPKSGLEEGRFNRVAKLFFRKREIKRVLEDLQSPRKDVRLAAIERAKALKPPAALPLLESLAEEDPEPEVRRDALRAWFLLAFRLNKPVTAFLMQKLQDGDHEVRLIAADLLVWIGPWKRIFETIMRDPDPHVRYVMVNALRKIKDPAATTTLRSVAFRDPDHDVRVAAAELLVDRGDETGLPVLLLETWFVGIKDPKPLSPKLFEYAVTQLVKLLGGKAPSKAEFSRWFESKLSEPVTAKKVAQALDTLLREPGAVPSLQSEALILASSRRVPVNLEVVIDVAERDFMSSGLLLDKVW